MGNLYWKAAERFGVGVDIDLYSRRAVAEGEGEDDHLLGYIRPMDKLFSVNASWVRRRDNLAAQTWELILRPPSKAWRHRGGLVPWRAVLCCWRQPGDVEFKLAFADTVEEAKTLVELNLALEA